MYITLNQVSANSVTMGFMFIKSSCSELYLQQGIQRLAAQPISNKMYFRHIYFQRALLSMCKLAALRHDLLSTRSTSSKSIFMELSVLYRTCTIKISLLSCLARVHLGSCMSLGRILNESRMGSKLILDAL